MLERLQMFLVKTVDRIIDYSKTDKITKELFDIKHLIYKIP